MKAILVIDMPSVCEDCFYHITDVRGYHYCGLTQCFMSKDIDVETEKEPWCPLRPLPDRKNVDFHPNIPYALGWNACIDEIIGETE